MAYVQERYMNATVHLSVMIDDPTQLGAAMAAVRGGDQLVAGATDEQRVLAALDDFLGENVAVREQYGIRLVWLKPIEEHEAGMERWRKARERPRWWHRFRRA